MLLLLPNVNSAVYAIIRNRLLPGESYETVAIMLLVYVAGFFVQTLQANLLWPCSCDEYLVEHKSVDCVLIDASVSHLPMEVAECVTMLYYLSERSSSTR